MPQEIVLSHREGTPRRLALKRVVQAVAAVAVAPRRLSLALSGPLFGRARAFEAASESIARVPGMWGLYLRQAFYRRTLASCGGDVYFGWLSTFSKRQARVGEAAYIGRHCVLGLVDLGARVMLADGVQVLSGARQHTLSERRAESHQEQPQTFVRIRIGDGAWLGAGALVMADVSEGAVVGAGAVVTRAVAARSVVAGVPARVVRQLDPERT